MLKYTTLQSMHLTIFLNISNAFLVTSTAKEPIRGWINNLYGPTGVTAGAMKGILRTFPGDGECPAELVPVDYVINSIIACAWDTSTRL